MGRTNDIVKIQGEIDFMLKNSWDLMKTDIKSALDLTKKAEKLSKKLNYEKGIALSLILLARYNNFQGRYEKALDLANQGNEIAIKKNILEAQINASYVLGNLYGTLGNLDSALIYFLKGFNLIKENNLEIDPSFLNNIGVVYSQSDQLDEALEFFKEALKIAKKTGHEILSLVLSNIAEVYIRKNNREVALEYNKKALKVYESNNADIRYLAQCYNIFGVIYKDMGQWDKALENFQTSLKMYQENKQKFLEAAVLYDIGKLYIAQEKREEAISYLQKAMKKVEKVNGHGLLRDILITLAETFEKDKNYKAAYDCLKRSNELNDKIKNSELNEKLIQHMTEFKVEKAQKDAEIQRLRNERLIRKNEETALKAKALAESYKDIKIIGEIGQKITSTLDIKKVLNMVYKNIQRLMDAHVFGICLYDKEAGRINFKILIEQGKRLPLYHVMIDNEKSYAAKCIREKREICINNLIVDNNQQLRIGASEDKFKSQSVIYYPLVMGDTVVGAMTVQSYSENAYSERSLEMIKALASYIAIALNNSQKSEELKAKTNELEIISKTDVLTGLYNRRHIMSKIDEEAVRYERSDRDFSIVLLDIDFFKNINDIYGHDCGDFILVKVTKILKKLIRKQDVLARWGGEEFLILLPETNEEGAISLCERVRTVVESTNFVYKKKKIKLTLTFGIAQYSDNLSVDATINNADKALYCGKNKGRNCVVCMPYETIKF